MGTKELPPVYKHVSRMAKKGMHVDMFNSPTGKHIECFVTPYRIHVFDQEETYYELKAFINHGIAEFTFSTRRINGDLRLAAHPDFYAGKFVGFALDYFTQQKQEPTTIRGRWSAETLAQVWGEYMDARRTTDSKVAAASQTWSGKTYAAHGYFLFREADVQEEGSLVEAYFRKEQPYDPNAPAPPTALNE